MTDVSEATGSDPAEVNPADVVAKTVAEVATPAVPPPAQPDSITQLADLLRPQIGTIVQTAIADAMKGNFTGILSDTKTAAVNYALQDAVSAGKALEQMVYNHISTLGVSKELDVAKGKMTDAFMWIEKHLGITS